MKKKQIPDTSKAAFESLIPDKIGGMYLRIMGALFVIQKGTFEEISAHMKVDKSRVWKRLSEMERLELIWRPGTKKLLRSGRNGYEWALRSTYIPKTQATEKALKGKAIVDYSRRLISDKQAAKQLDLL